MPKGTKLRLDFNISIKSFAEFIALSNNSYFQELENNKYRIKNGIFKYNNGIIEELTNCKDCMLSLDYYTGIICLYMQNTSLYNYNSNSEDENFAFYALQNYTLCFQKTEKDIQEKHNGLISLFDHYYLLTEMFMLMKRFPEIDSHFIASKTKDQETRATLDNNNNIIESLKITSDNNRKTIADEGCFRIVEKDNERFPFCQ